MQKGVKDSFVCVIDENKRWPRLIVRTEVVTMAIVLKGIFYLSKDNVYFFLFPVFW